MKVYFYLLYVLRRFPGGTGYEHGFREWRAIFVLTIVEANLAIVTLNLIEPRIIQTWTARTGAVIIVTPILAMTYLIIGDGARYARYIASFESWPAGKRQTADALSAAFILLSLALPALV